MLKRDPSLFVPSSLVRWTLHRRFMPDEHLAQIYLNAWKVYMVPDEQRLVPQICSPDILRMVNDVIGVRDEACKKGTKLESGYRYITSSMRSIILHPSTVMTGKSIGKRLGTILRFIFGVDGKYPKTVTSRYSGVMSEFAEQQIFVERARIVACERQRKMRGGLKVEMGDPGTIEFNQNMERIRGIANWMCDNDCIRLPCSSDEVRFVLFGTVREFGVGVLPVIIDEFSIVSKWGGLRGLDLVDWLKKRTWRKLC